MEKIEASENATAFEILKGRVSKLFKRDKDPSVYLTKKEIAALKEYLKSFYYELEEKGQLIHFQDYPLILYIEEYSI